MTLGSAGAGAADVHTLVLARSARLRMAFILRSMGAQREPCEGRPQPRRRSTRWVPTRRALAMAVSEGFTAPMLGMKLVSTT
jgi:hypothetical protein